VPFPDTLGLVRMAGHHRSRCHPVVVRRNGSGQGPGESESSLPRFDHLRSGLLCRRFGDSAPCAVRIPGAVPTPAQSSFAVHLALPVGGGMAGGILAEESPVALAGTVRTAV